MIVLGVILSLCGGVGLFYAIDQRDTFSYGVNSLIGGSTSEVDIVYYASIAALILGVILIIAGLSKSSKSKANATLQQVTPPQRQPIVPVQYFPNQYSSQNNNASQRKVVCKNCCSSFNYDPQIMFCSKCGSTIEDKSLQNKNCIMCNSANDIDNAFCSICGSKF